MKNIRIALGDLRHETVGAHSTYTPVGIGYMATYLQSQLSCENIEIRLFTKPDEILDCVDSWSPHVLGLSHYMWNAALSYQVCEYAKQKDEQILSILGGPEFPSGSGQSSLSSSKDLCLDYLLERPAVDYYCYSDGETALVSVIEHYIECEHNVRLMKDSAISVDGTVSIAQQTQKLLIGKPQLRVGLEKNLGRDVIPSPYLSGLLDNFLDGSYIPAIESKRGCPFQCTFCDQGLDITKIVSFSTERICEELTYIAKKVAILKESRTLAFFDSNWGLYKGDVVVAAHLADIIEQWDWPKVIDISTPKNKKERILEIDAMLKNRVDIALSQQSMNRDTLEEIKRANYTNEQYLDFVRELKSRGKAITCELIIPLPGETEESYYNSVKVLMDNGLRISTYTLMMLMGAELGRSQARKQFSMKSRYRVVPRQFGEYRGKKCFDIEEVCVQTDTMPYDAYLRCRRFSFLVEMLSYIFFDPMRRYLLEIGVSYYDLLRTIHQEFESNRSNKELSRVYADFSLESEAELFESRESIQSFFENPTNYERLLQGELGDNLLRKYSTIMLARHLDQLVEYCYDLIFSRFRDKIDGQYLVAGSAVKNWIKSSQFLTEFVLGDREQWQIDKVIKLSHDVPTWLKNADIPLAEFSGDLKYRLRSRSEELDNELGPLYGESKEYQVGKVLHTRSVTEFFCESVRAD